MPVQRVCRPNHEFRGFQGQIESGKIKVGQTITTLPSNETATVKSLLERKYFRRGSSDRTGSNDPA